MLKGGAALMGSALLGPLASEAQAEPATVELPFANGKRLLAT
jgi:hypothetical protein